MAFHIEKDTGDIVIDTFETGIAPSPHKGIANIQAANISTENGEVMCSYARSQQSMTSTATTGSLAFSNSSHVSLSISGSNNLFKGMWITVSGSSHGGELADGNYYVQLTAAGDFVLSQYYGGSGITGYTAGLTATIGLLKTMSTPVAWAFEKYTSGTNVFYRYYVLDSQGLVWVYDTANEVLFSSTDNVNWFLPDFVSNYFDSDTAPSGIGVLNGWIHVTTGNRIFVKQTVNLGGISSTSSTWQVMDNVTLMGKANNPNPHTILVGHQGRLYYGDGNYLGSIFPDTSLLTITAPNIQSYCSFTASATTGTIGNVIGGSIPSTGINVGTTGFSRIPAVFFTAQGGAIPAALSANVVYYIQYTTAASTFEVYAAITGGSAKDIATGSSGTQYFNTYYPVGTHAAAYGDTTTITYTPQRLNLPYSEVVLSMTEVGNNVIIGGIGNVLYPWNQVDALPGNLITLPENKTVNLITVNQMAYAFVGNKGDIYITDGSVASLALKVPDYCAGIAGTPASYIEPYFTWGGGMYLRGRVYFSILDQTSTKAGNCGGVWSFVPTQNLYIGQDTGLALRLENQNSYGTYNGVAPVLIPKQTQDAVSPQYWSAWYSSISSAKYGIDVTGSNTTQPASAIIETDLMQLGTVLKKYTPSQIEYTLAAPLIAGESVTMKWRQDATSAFTSGGTAVTEGATSLSGYFVSNFQGGQLIQLQLTLSTINPASSSMVRLQSVRMRNK